MLRIVPPTVPRVGRSDEHFPDGFELHLLRHLRTGVPRSKETTPLGPYSRPMPRTLRWSYGGGAVSYERGTPVGLIFKAHRLLYHSTLGSREVKKKKNATYHARPFALQSQFSMIVSFVDTTCPQRDSKNVPGFRIQEFWRMVSGSGCDGVRVQCES